MTTSNSTLSPDSKDQTSHLQLVRILLWAIVVGLAGGSVCGLAISKLGTLGAASLWLLGEGAGTVGRKIMPQKNKMAGTVLVAACLCSFIVAEVCWLHWNTVQGEESWLTAIRLLPTFVEEYTVSAIIGAIFAAIGASAAYRHVARRYRIVQVVEE